MTVELHAREYVTIVSTGRVVGLLGTFRTWLITMFHKRFFR
ncbi:hypothetical protein [Salmonella enterica]